LKAKYFLIILFVFSLLNVTGLPCAIANEYYSVTTNSWLDQSVAHSAQVQSKIDELKNRKLFSNSGHSTKGNLTLADPAKSVAKTTQSKELQAKEHLRIARKNALIKMLGSRPARKNLMMVNSNKANNE
jgi:hypothetical protein